ncbi:type 1 glutamine amidotransferase domain-containing protein [Flavobacterium sp. ZT3R18]|uniref:type 1 glutamine amidotransferase domain-containing protein n=1 Tax=Flavobacterium sp. ZT3R18 TaxID=2594429 RepID=UPI001179ADF1|nr:type 1 glutamine amidotransferase domain-containing protein [Flavobacterium sp. ZT3R18]TRX32044.1 type 1 glutamine amidotransferase domain-containing protein [Flavobacterium sp. ZT3R18]
MKHILFIVTSADRVGTSNVKTGYEFSEVADPYLEFTRAGYTVDFASILGGLPPEDGYDDSNSNSKLFRKSAGFKRLNFSHRLKNIDIEAYDGVFFPGGLGPMVDLVDNKLAKSIIAKMYESGKIVAAVCHGPVAFLNVKLSNGKFLLDSKKVTSFTEAEEKVKKHHLETVIPFLLDEALINEGANFSNTEPFESYVIADGNIITGQNPSSASDVAKAIIQKLDK